MAAGLAAGQVAQPVRAATGREFIVAGGGNGSDAFRTSGTGDGIRANLFGTSNGACLWQ